MTDEIALLVPSLGRPQNAERLIQAWEATTEGRSDLWFFLDDNDPTVPDYFDVLRHTGARIEVGPPARLVEWTNRAAVDRMYRYAVLGSIGDDHVPETAGWETAIMDAVVDLGGVGIVYGDDAIQHEAIPTACFMTSNIVRALGWMAPPTLEHLFCDDAWRAISDAAGCRRYLPDVKITHYHPTVCRAPNDATYERGNSVDVWARDRAGYEAWLADGLEVAAAKVRALRASIGGRTVTTSPSRSA